MGAPPGWRTVTPRIVVRDVAAVVEFTKRVFGATGELHEDRPSVMTIGDSHVMISGAGPRPETPAFLYVYVDDPDAIYRRAIKAGARSLEKPVEMPYGDRRAMVEDRWGNVWQIAKPHASTEHPVDPASFETRRIGVVRSVLADRKNAPRQGDEGAPDAWIELDASIAPALDGVAVGDEIILLSWMHLANREVLKVRPRGDPRAPLTGVFATRSPDRPNPIGMHQVTVRAVDGPRFLVGPLEAIDGTPIVDVKPVLAASIPARSARPRSPVKPASASRPRAKPASKKRRSKA